MEQQNRVKQQLFEAVVRRTLESFKDEGHIGVDLRELPHWANWPGDSADWHGPRGDAGRPEDGGDTGRGEVQ